MRLIESSGTQFYGAAVKRPNAALTGAGQRLR
jgi:hypothetical protein